MIEWTKTKDNWSGTAKGYIFSISWDITSRGFDLEITKPDGSSLGEEYPWYDPYHKYGSFHGAALDCELVLYEDSLEGGV